jgi:preprotein translocase subunit SecD
MQLIPRAFASAVLAATLVLSGCQTPPAKTPDTAPASSAAAPQTVQPVEFFVAQTQAAAGLTAVQVPDGVIYLRGPSVLNRADLTDAAALVDRQGQNFVGLRFTPDGARKLGDISRRNVGGMLALVIGRELVAAPKITGTLDRGVLAFSVPTAEAASDIAARIRGDAP